MSVLERIKALLMGCNNIFSKILVAKQIILVANFAEITQADN